ncbi:DUF3611 family protein [Sedimentitalea sp. JM2-8]|uniref:DUF3611 family protein n=1 Tax=Sedimentitalea xiamensis TaxID=3050037 RepID=A0ABT7FCS2_9RHOB|nr:DUF3611 family protein [Sedimentitalea xiamensis]MDK3072913.1 DUF3611 family protein [Sedimentitalea xiamensis]
MSKTVMSWKENQTAGVSKALLRFGHFGFWLQLVFLVVIVLLGGYVARIVRGGIGLENFLALIGLLLPLFTTFWCRVYIFLGRAMAGPEKPNPARVRNRVWIGFWAGTLGISVSMLSLFGAASALLVTMLSNPQVGIQVSPATGGATAYTVSAIDAVSIFALLLTQTSELLVAAISLRLVFLVARSTRQETAE